MITRPLFDSLPAVKPEPRPGSKTPTLPARAKIPPQVWTVQFTAAPDGNVPPVCRIRKVLKNAWRCYRLKAKVIAQSTPAALPGNSTSSQSSYGQPVRRTLKTALRAHGLRAVAIECVGDAGTPGNSTHDDIPSDGPRGPQTGCNEAGQSANRGKGKQ